MISNGKQGNQSGINDKVITALLSIASAGVIGCFAFFWKVNGVMTRLEERDTQNIKAREDQIMKTNSMQLDIRDIRERLIRIETKQMK